MTTANRLSFRPKGEISSKHKNTSQEVSTLMASKEAPTLHGYRRDLTKETFEDLAALQCEIPEILGYAGADLPALEATLKAHVQGRVSLYKSYAPELVEQASAAEIVTEGRYMALIMCEDRAAVKAAFLAGVR